MTIRVKLSHKTSYHYDRLVTLGPQTVRLRPAPHCRTPVTSYSLSIEPSEHFLNWQQDPHGNFLARLVFNQPTRRFEVTVDLVAEMTVINPFDFFLDDSATEFPFTYAPELAADLAPFLAFDKQAPLQREYCDSVDVTPRRTMDFLVDLNQRVQKDVSYIVRMEPGVQTPEETLTRRIGSCRDSAWLLVHLLRRFGLAARFVSGYLIQLTPDVKPLEGPEGPTEDFTDLHAWTEVFLPGAGWVGLDPTSGLLAGEGHLPLAATPMPQTAAPISGGVEPSEVEFAFQMQVTRVHEDPRVTKPYTRHQWHQIDALGETVDRRLFDHDVRLTMGGEPTFVSIDDMEGEEWNSAATGIQKQKMSVELIRRLQSRFGTGGLLHYGQGKWYPGEPLPRWAYSCIWRADGEPVWNNPALLGTPAAEQGGQLQQQDGNLTEAAEQFICHLAEELGVPGKSPQPAYEDVLHMLELEQNIPLNVDPADFDVDSDDDRRRLARALARGLQRPVGFVLPLTRAWWQARPRWITADWSLRAGRIVLVPGDSPLGLRLPIASLSTSKTRRAAEFIRDPTDTRRPLPGYAELRSSARRLVTPDDLNATVVEQQRRPSVAETGVSDSPEQLPADEGLIIPTALCVEPRDGQLHVFMPPTGSLEDYLDLVACVEATAETLNLPVVVEGYLPPADDRLRILKVTPDPGVIEVNVHPAHDWSELKSITQGVYEEARATRLGTEKFELDGRHSGTGGGNHLVVGGPTPVDSPFLRRPDLLRSVIGFWNNHPSLSYLFSSLFIGPTSQSPRMDEGRRDALSEMEIAFRQIPNRDQTCPPWLVDRIFRNLLIDLTGNTHRAEICIDKLYSPDHSTGRLGLVEFRAFEMPPHSEMSLVQQLLVRSLISVFWETPFQDPLIHWGTAIHDRFMMPYHLWQDLEDIAAFLQRHGIAMDAEWFQPHLEFRCPLIGEYECEGLSLEFRQALEPWYVLGEEPGAGGTTRFVDSSLERLQVHVRGLHSQRFRVAVNGVQIPLQATRTPGDYVAAIRYRAWQPPRCLQPTIGPHAPLTFDIVDTVQQLAIGGCQYHVGHPGGLNSESIPVNALEAESRRAARFFRYGHTPGVIIPQSPRTSPEFPCTLDLRLTLPTS